MTNAAIDAITEGGPAAAQPSVGQLLEQAFNEGRFTPLPEGIQEHQTLAREAVITLMLKLHDKGEKLVAPDQALLDALSRHAAKPFARHERNVLHFLDRVCFQLKADASLDDRLLLVFNRLRLPLGHLALAEPMFLLSSKHPMRIFLDTICQFGCSWYEGLGKQGERFIERVKEAVTAIYCDQTPELALIDKINRELMKDLQLELKRANILEERLLQAETAVINNRRARQAVHAMLNEKMEGFRLPALAITFLQGVWRDTLHLELVKHGAESEEWATLTRLTDELILTVFPTVDEQHKKITLSLIPALAEQVPEWLHKNAGQQQHHDTYEPIEQIHMELLRNREVDAVDMEPLPFIENTGANTRVADNLMARVSDLVEGQWLLYTNQRGELIRCKIALKIEDADIIMMVNRLGIKCLEKTFSEVAYDLSTGKMKVLENERLFTHALETAALKFLREFRADTRANAAEIAQQNAVDESRNKAIEKAKAEVAALMQAKENAAQQALLAAEEARQHAAEIARIAQQKEDQAQFAVKQQATEKAQQIADQTANEVQQAQRAREVAIKKAVGTLAVGDWFDMKNKAGEPVRCRLAVIFASTGRLVFVDKHGIKQAEMVRQELADLLLRDEAVLLKKTDNFDSSLSRVINTLRNN